MQTVDPELQFVALNPKTSYVFLSPDATVDGGTLSLAKVFKLL